MASERIVGYGDDLYRAADFYRPEILDLAELLDIEPERVVLRAIEEFKTRQKELVWETLIGLTRENERETQRCG